MLVVRLVMVLSCFGVGAADDVGPGFGGAVGVGAGAVDVGGVRADAVDADTRPIYPHQHPSSFL